MTPYVPPKHPRLARMINVASAMLRSLARGRTNIAVTGPSRGLHQSRHGSFYDERGFARSYGYRRPKAKKGSHDQT